MASFANFLRQQKVKQEAHEKMCAKTEKSTENKRDRETERKRSRNQQQNIENIHELYVFMSWISLFASRNWAKMFFHQLCMCVFFFRLFFVFATIVFDRPSRAEITKTPFKSDPSQMLRPNWRQILLTNNNNDDDEKKATIKQQQQQQYQTNRTNRTTIRNFTICNNILLTAIKWEYIFQQINLISSNELNVQNIYMARAVAAAIHFI